MATRLTHGLALHLLEYERTPEAPIDCLEFAANASIGGFKGRTRFSVYRRDLERFLDRLDATVKASSCEADLRCGWGEDVYFEIRAFHRDRLGHIAVEVELADEGTGERMRRLLVDLQTEPSALERFAASWRRVMEQGDTAPFQLDDLTRHDG